MSTRIFKSILAISFALTFLACSLLTSQSTSGPSVADIEKEEQEVYSFFVREQDTAFLLSNTSTGLSDEDPQQIIDSIKSSLTDVSNETLDSFVERNQEPSQLSPDMDLGVKYELLSEPTSGGYFMFSRVGFNNALDQALVYVGHVAAPLAGSGSYYLMEKQDGEWTVKEQIMVWIS